MKEISRLKKVFDYKLASPANYKNAETTFFHSHDFTY